MLELVTYEVLVSPNELELLVLGHPHRRYIGIQVDETEALRNVGRKHCVLGDCGAIDGHCRSDEGDEEVSKENHFDLPGLGNTSEVVGEGGEEERHVPNISQLNSPPTDAKRKRHVAYHANKRGEAFRGIVLCPVSVAFEGEPALYNASSRRRPHWRIRIREGAMCAEKQCIALVCSSDLESMWNYIATAGLLASSGETVPQLNKVETEQRIGSATVGRTDATTEGRRETLNGSRTATASHWNLRSNNGSRSGGVLDLALAFVSGFPLPRARYDWILGEVDIISRKSHNTLCLPCGPKHVS